MNEVTLSMLPESVKDDLNKEWVVQEFRIKNNVIHFSPRLIDSILMRFLKTYFEKTDQEKIAISIIEIGDAVEK
jgi:hypothetical protein